MQEKSTILSWLLVGARGGGVAFILSASEVTTGNGFAPWSSLLSIPNPVLSVPQLFSEGHKAHSHAASRRCCRIKGQRSW